MKKIVIIILIITLACPPQQAFALRPQAAKKQKSAPTVADCEKFALSVSPQATSEQKINAVNYIGGILKQATNPPKSESPQSQGDLDSLSLSFTATAVDEKTQALIQAGAKTLAKIFVESTDKKVSFHALKTIVTFREKSDAGQDPIFAGLDDSNPYEIAKKELVSYNRRAIKPLCAAIAGREVICLGLALAALNEIGHDELIRHDIDAMQALVRDHVVPIAAGDVPEAGKKATELLVTLNDISVDYAILMLSKANESLKAKGKNAITYAQAAVSILSSLNIEPRLWDKTIEPLLVNIEAFINGLWIGKGAYKPLQTAIRALKQKMKSNSGLDMPDMPVLGAQSKPAQTLTERQVLSILRCQPQQRGKWVAIIVEQLPTEQDERVRCNIEVVLLRLADISFPLILRKAAASPGCNSLWHILRQMPRHLAKVSPNDARIFNIIAVKAYFAAGDASNPLQQKLRTDVAAVLEITADEQAIKEVAQNLDQACQQKDENKTTLTAALLEKLAAKASGAVSALAESYQREAAEANARLTKTHLGHIDTKASESAKFFAKALAHLIKKIKQVAAQQKKLAEKRARAIVGFAQSALRPMASEAKISKTSEDITPVEKKAKKNISTKRKIAEVVFIAAVLAAVVITVFATYQYYLAFRAFSMVLSTMTISFISYSIGDFLRQRINIIWGPQSKMDYKHILRCGLTMSVVAGFFVGFLWHDLCLTSEGLERAAKAIIDQGIFMPPYFATFSLSMGKFFIEKKPFNTAVKKSMQEWSVLVPWCLVFWVPALIIIYIIFQPQTPVLWIYIASLLWTIPSTYFINLEQKENLQKIERNIRILNKTMKYTAPTAFTILTVSAAYGLWPIVLMCTLAISWPVFFVYYVRKILDRDKKQAGEKVQVLILLESAEPGVVSAAGLALRSSLLEGSSVQPGVTATATVWEFVRPPELKSFGRLSPAATDALQVSALRPKTSRAIPYNSSNCNGALRPQASKISERKRMLIKYGIYTQEEFAAAQELCKRFLTGEGLSHFSAYEKVCMWQYAILTEQRETKLFHDLNKAVKSVAVNLEVEDLYLGYQWKDHLDSHDKVRSIEQNLRIKLQTRVLDVGCGYGNVIIELADKYPRTEFVGIDANPYNLSQAITRLIAMGDDAPRNIKFHIRDCRQPLKGRIIPQRGIPYEDDAFDAVLVLEGVMDEDAFSDYWHKPLWTEIIRATNKNEGTICFFGLKGRDAFSRCLPTGIEAERAQGAQFSIKGKRERYFVPSWGGTELAADRTEFYVWQLRSRNPQPELAPEPVITAPVSRAPALPLQVPLEFALSGRVTEGTIWDLILQEAA